MRTLGDSILALALCCLFGLYSQRGTASPILHWTKPVPVTEVNTEYRDEAPFLSADGLTLYFARSLVSGWSFAHIHQAIRPTLSEPFGSVREIVELTEPDGHVTHPWVSSDELRMYYYSSGGSRRRLRIAERPFKGAAWQPGPYLSELDSLGDVANPSLSADELIIVFDGLSLAGGKGGWDLWMASRTEIGQPFTNVTNLGAVNTSGSQGHPSLSADGLTLYFISSPTGNSQIFQATRPSRCDPFGPPKHLAVFDTPDGRSEYPFISADGETFYFGAWPNGQWMDIYVSQLSSALAFYVDAASGDDSNDGQSPETAFATIQKAIDVAEDGDVVNVSAGTYRESLYFQGKAITVQSAGDAATLEAPGRFAVSFYMGEGPETVLRNFVVTNSYVGVVATDSSPSLMNVTVVGNELGIEAYRSAHPRVINSILWGNTESDLYGCVATYSCVERGAEGAGNFSADPLFVDPENGDYHLRSERGRYWPEHDVWVLDEVSSPCIDAGDPNADFSRERQPNGGRVNIGAHGGTPFASRSPGQLPGRASDPSPADGAAVPNMRPTLSWTPGTGAASHDVYFGSTNPPAFVGNQTGAEFGPGTLTMGTTYSWRVDEINSAGKTSGPVWSFTIPYYKGRSCFTSETPVWIDGRPTPISQVDPGMKVCFGKSARTESSLVMSPPLGRVEKTHAHEGAFICYDVLFESGNSIRVAGCHYFLAESGRWVSLQELRQGARLQTATGVATVRIVAQRSAPYVGIVYNLSVPASHRYLVGKDAVIVRDY